MAMLCKEEIEGSNKISFDRKDLYLDRMTNKGNDRNVNATTKNAELDIMEQKQTELM